MPDLSYIWKDPLFSKPITGAKVRRILTLGIAEMTGTGIFINLGCAAHSVSPQLGAGAVFLDIVITFSFAIGMGVLLVNHVSGSLLNPALALAMVILGHFSIYRCVLYIVFQCAGGALGVMFNYLLVPDLQSNYCISDRKPEINVFTSFTYEILFSGLLTWALAALVDKRRIKGIRNISIKFVFVVVPILLNITRLMGINVNPAKAFGGAIVGMDFTEFWVFFVGPFIGAIIISLLYMVMFNPIIEEKAEAKNLPNVVDE